MEPTRYTAPDEAFLTGCKELADANGAVLIFDEIVTGFRMALGCARKDFGVVPDIAVLAKTISNGYPMAAIVGRQEVMSMVEDQLISSTYWTDAIGTAAAIAAIPKIRETKVIDHIWSPGKTLMAGLQTAFDNAGLDAEVKGWPPFAGIVFHHQCPDMVMAMKTHFIRGMLRRGFLTTGLHYLML